MRLTLLQSMGHLTSTGSSKCGDPSRRLPLANRVVDQGGTIGASVEWAGRDEVAPTLSATVLTVRAPTMGRAGRPLVDNQNRVPAALPYRPRRAVAHDVIAGTRLKSRGVEDVNCPCVSLRSTGMDVIEAIHTRRSVRSYSPRLVERELIEEMIWDAAQAPPPFSGQMPWTFNVVQGVERISAYGDEALQYARDNHPDEPGWEWTDQTRL